MGHLAGECTQMGRFALRHQIYDPPPSENNQFARNNYTEGDQQVNSYAVSTDKSREGVETDKYHQAYRELRQRDPIASMDETVTEYPSQDYRQLDQLIEERRYSRQQTPKRELDKKKYQPRRLAGPNEIELGLPRTAWTPRRDPEFSEIYPIPEEEEEGRSSGRQRKSIKQENTWKQGGSSRNERTPSPPPIYNQGPEEVLELLEEEEEEMDPVVLVEMKDQTGDGGEDSEEENDSSVASARMRGQRGRPGPVGPRGMMDQWDQEGILDPWGPEDHQEYREFLDLGDHLGISNKTQTQLYHL